MQPISNALTLPVIHTRTCVALGIALVLVGCGSSQNCSTKEDAAKYLAKFAADVQEASNKNKLPMDKLNLLQLRLESAGNHYSAKENPTEFCDDIDSLRKDFGL